MRTRVIIRKDAHKDYATLRPSIVCIEREVDLLEHELVGEWDLVAAELRGSGGEVVPIYGQPPFGRLIYTGSGYMTALLTDPNRPRLGGDTSTVTESELRAAFQQFIAYCGTYTVDAAAGAVAHHVDGSFVPDWVGSDQVRYFELHDNQLVLTTPPMQMADQEWVSHFAWQRRSASNSA